MIITERDTGASVQIKFYRHQPQALKHAAWSDQSKRRAKLGTVVLLLIFSCAAALSYVAVAGVLN